MAKVYYAIYMNGRFIEKVKGLENAKAKIRMYERQDRYEVEVEKYPMPPAGYPVYTIQ